MICEKLKVFEILSLCIQKKVHTKRWNNPKQAETTRNDRKQPETIGNNPKRPETTHNFYETTRNDP